jgi:hypothetical protein
MAKEKHIDRFDVNKPLDRLFLRIFAIYNATNKPFALGFDKSTQEYNLTIGNEENQSKFEGDILDIELQLSMTFSWHYCIECGNNYQGGYCQCQASLL